MNECNIKSFGRYFKNSQIPKFNIKNPSNIRHSCECKLGYAGSGQWGDCRDVCENRCRNEVRYKETKNLQIGHF